MLPLILAAGLAGQYPTPQAPQYGAPPPQTYAAPVTYAAPQVVVLGAGQVVPPGPFDRLLGHIGQSLLKHSWPRVQPAATMQAPVAPVAQVVYVSIQQQPVMQASYVVQTPQLPYASPPYAGGKQAPQAQYGTPQQPAAQQPQMNAPKHDETVPPVPAR
jgi:hypothetical protein